MVIGKPAAGSNFARDRKRRTLRTGTRAVSGGLPPAGRKAYALPRAPAVTSTPRALGRCARTCA